MYFCVYICAQIIWPSSHNQSIQRRVLLPFDAMMNSIAFGLVSQIDVESHQIFRISTVLQVLNCNNNNNSSSAAVTVNRVSDDQLTQTSGGKTRSASYKQNNVLNLAGFIVYSGNYCFTLHIYQLSHPLGHYD